jgi:hypothetical protein
VIMPRHPHPPGKSKTDLRRGHFAPGHPAARKNIARCVNTATTHAEQALLFDETATVDSPRPARESR